MILFERITFQNFDFQDLADRHIHRPQIAIGICLCPHAIDQQHIILAGLPAQKYRGLRPGPAGPGNLNACFLADQITKGGSR